MRVYISGAITGVDDYMERFAEAERCLTKLGYSVFNPAKINAQLPHDLTYEEHMWIDLGCLKMCGSIYMLRGWRKSLGANREYGYALAKGYEIIDEETA